MAFCSNCGAQHSDAEKFCGECGYPTAKTAAPVQTAQPQQAVAPPPIQQPAYQSEAPVKKKSKKPLIIGGATGVVVLGLAAVLIFTNGFGLFGNGNGNGGGGDITIPTVSSGIKVNIPGGASADEKAAYEYLQGVLKAFENGMEYDEMGLIRPAESLYGTAASTLCSLRYAADCLLGEENDDGRTDDWDTIASMGWGSPAAYFFEGLVCQAQGKADEAAACWKKAAVNPLFGNSGDALKGIANIKGDALRRLRDEAARVEDEIYKLYTPSFYPVPRHENNYDPVYLSQQGAACLEKDEPDPAGALMYYRAALSVNPFSGYNYACVVVAYISMGDGETAEDYLTEGLIIDPENQMLNELINKIEEVANQ